MVSQQEILIVDSGEHSLRPIASKLRGLGYRISVAKTTEGAHDLLVDPRHDIGAAIITQDLPASSLAGAVAGLRDVASRHSMPVIVSGPRAALGEARESLIDACIDMVLVEPLDDHTLRFQINRALSEPDPDRERRHLRVPTDWPVRLRVGAREKEARVYSVSATGAYLATSRPSVTNALVHLTLPLPAGAVTTSARVVMTNVPGNLKRGNLPVGMGVRFTGTPSEISEAIDSFARARHQHLVL